MLFVYGFDDNVVFVYYSWEMEDEFKDEGKDVIYIEFEDGDYYLLY